MADGSSSVRSPVAGGAAYSPAARRKGSFAHSDVLKYRQAFDTAKGANSDGIKAADLHKVIRKLGYRISEDSINNLLEHNGLNESSEINFLQFLDIVPKNIEDISEEDHRLADFREKFARYDVDHNGVISLQEAQWALQSEFKISTKTALRLLNQFVKLNYDQFVEFYTNVQHKKIEIYDKFGKYDLDKDGLISVEEAHNVLHKELGFNEKRSKAMVEKYDFNHDGKVSYIEFAEFYLAVEEKKDQIRAAFLHFDEEQKGYVSAEQADVILQGTLGFSEEKSKTTIAQYDSESNGKIRYEGFLRLYSMIEEEAENKRQSIQMRERLLQEFKRYDANHDGRISFAEFKDMLLQEGFCEEDIQKLFPEADKNKNGFLDFNEFKSYLNFNDHTLTNNNA